MISLTLIILQIQSLLHLLIFPSVIHHCFLIIIGQYLKTNTKVITSLSSLNRTLFPLRTTIQSGNLIEPTGISLILCALVNWCQKTSKNLLILYPLLLSKYLKYVFLKLPQIQLKVIHGTMTTVNKQLYSANKLYLNSKDLQIPTISMASKYLELKRVKQLKFRNASHGDHTFRKSIIKHLFKRFGI